MNTLVAVQKDWVIGTLCFFEEPFSRARDEGVVESIAELPLDDLIVEEVEISGEVKPFATMPDVGDVGDDFLQRLVRAKVSVQDAPYLCKR